MKTLEQVKKGIEEWNNRLKNCQCHTPLHTTWGSDYKIGEIYKYTILTYEELMVRGDHSLMTRPVVINHNRGTDRLTIPDFKKHFFDFQTIRDNKINQILE
jgi:hypothetical protein